MRGDATGRTALVEERLRSEELLYVLVSSWIEARKEYTDRDRDHENLDDLVGLVRVEAKKLSLVLLRRVMSMLTSFLEFFVFMGTLLSNAFLPLLSAISVSPSSRSTFT